MVNFLIHASGRGHLHHCMSLWDGTQPTQSGTLHSIYNEAGRGVHSAWLCRSKNWLFGFCSWVWHAQMDFTEVNSKITPCGWCNGYVTPSTSTPRSVPWAVIMIKLCSINYFWQLFWGIVTKLNVWSSVTNSCMKDVNDSFVWKGVLNRFWL